MAIGLRASGSTSADVNATSTTVTKPSGSAAGDVAILSVGIASSAITCATPTGWTVVGTVANANANAAVFYRVIQAGDSTWTVNPRGIGVQFGLVLQTFTGVDNVNPIDATGTGSGNASTTTITAGAVTVATDQAWELIGGGTFNGGGSATGFTALDNGATPTNEGAFLLYNQTPKSVGSTGTVTVTTTAGDKAVMPFALRPAAAASDTLAAQCWC